MNEATGRTIGTRPGEGVGRVSVVPRTVPPREGFTAAQAHAVALEIGLDLGSASFDAEEFRRGMEVELEHGRCDPDTNVTDDDPVTTGKIAWAHLKELPDYYKRLEQIESDA